MSIFVEGIHERLRNTFKLFDNFCKENGVFYSIVADEHDLQGYLVNKEHPDIVQELVGYMQIAARRGDVHFEHKSRKDGTLFTFTLETIQDESLSEDRAVAICAWCHSQMRNEAGEWVHVLHAPSGPDVSVKDAICPRCREKVMKRIEDRMNDLRESTNEQSTGHWQVVGAPYAMPGQPKKSKRSDYSPFAWKSDVKKVRAKKMPIQKLGNKEAQKASFNEELDEIFESQYKHPTTKHLRGQSAYPSSIGKTKSFGGISYNGGGSKGTAKEGMAVSEIEPPNMRPLGMFGPVDKRNPTSNDSSDGGIQTGGSKHIKGKYGERSSTALAGGRGVRRFGGGTRAEELDRALDTAMVESYKEDDVYTIVQRITLDAGLNTQTRKFMNSYNYHDHYSKACDGNVSIEAHPKEGYGATVSVFKDDKEIHNVEVNFAIGDANRNEDIIAELVEVVKKASKG